MGESFYLSPPFYKNYVKKLYCLKRQYPFLSLFSAGRSVQGRKIYAISVGKMQNPVIFMGAFHAQEWLTQSLLVKFTEEISKSISKKSELCSALNKRGVIIVPTINPDGVELALSNGASAASFKRFTDRVCGGDYSLWQSNIRGVDINHNFDAGHKILSKMERAAGIVGPAPRRYGGARPNSEPETKTAVWLCREFGASRVYAFHLQGEEIFFSYAGRVPTGAQSIAKMLSETSGYTLKTQSGLASHGGFKDWFIKEFSCPGFTIEIGRGANPLPISELSPIFARLYETMVLALVI